MAAVALAAIALGRPAPVAAADPTFGSPSAASTFLTGITFRQPVGSIATGTSAEIVISVGGSATMLVAEVPLTTAASQTLSYELELGPGGAVPSTAFSGRWRLTTADGVRHLGPPASATYDDDRFTWRTLEGDVVRMHWYQGSSAFGRQALSIAEDGVAEAAALLGVTERDPIDFYVYADSAPFYDVLGPASRENVGGVAYPAERVLLAQIDATAIDDAWVRTVIPHELTHIVFDSAVRNPYHGPPKWLNEGVATYLSEGYSSDRRAEVDEAVGNGRLMGLDALVGEFPTSRDRFSLAYSESASAIDYLVRTYGRNGLVDLVNAYAGGVSDDEAFRSGLGVDVAGFEAGWLASLGADAPATYGPRPAPAGPLPSDWSGAPPSVAPSGAPGTPEASPATSPGPTAEPGGGGRGGDGGTTAIVVGVLATAVVAAVGVVAWRRQRAGGVASGGPS